MIFGFGKKKKEKKDQIDSVKSVENELVDVEQVDQVEKIVEMDQAEEETAEVSQVDPVESIIETESVDQVDVDEPEVLNEPDHKASKGYFSRLKEGLLKTRSHFKGIFSAKKSIDEETLEDLETALLVADVGIESTQSIIQDVEDSLSRSELKDNDALIDQLKESMYRLLSHTEKKLDFQSEDGPFVLLMVGINGAGKTTTIGKIAQQLKSLDKSVMLAAGDTFRAAAVEQLRTWGDRVDVPVIAQETGSDSASVIYDAYQSAKAKDIDVLIADTAGRLHTQAHLMAEIEKIVRVLKKANANAPHEIMLVIDSGNGQNALNQAKEFHKVLGLTGITITKLDGSAKGGILFSIANQLNIPVRFIGVGETVDDLREFSAKDFIDALLEVDLN